MYAFPPLLVVGIVIYFIYFRTPSGSEHPALLPKPPEVAIPRRPPRPVKPPEPTPNSQPSTKVEDINLEKTLSGEQAPPNPFEVLQNFTAAKAWKLLMNGALVKAVAICLDEISQGERPVRSLSPYRSPEPFTATQYSDGYWYMDDACANRYTALVDLYCSKNAAKIGSAWKVGERVLQFQLNAMGYRDKTARDVAVEAINMLRSTPVLTENPPMVKLEDGLYHWQDPELEKLAPVQKLLLRMGPHNAARIRQQTEAIFEATGIK